MNLIIAEQRRTYAAHCQGKEWSDPDLVENSLSNFYGWLDRTRSELGIRLEYTVNPTEILLFRYHPSSGIDSHRLTITCENEMDRDELLRMIRAWFGLEPTYPWPSHDELSEALEAELLEDVQFAETPERFTTT